MNRCAAASPPRSVDDDSVTFVLLGDGAREESKDVFVAVEDVVREVDERDEDDFELDDNEYWLRQQIDDDLESIHLRELLHDDDQDDDDLVQRLLLDGDSENDVDQSVESEVESTPVHHQSRKAVQVTFGEVHVREYSVTLGNHPLCHQYPLTLDWAHTEATTYDDMDQYEEACQLSARKLQLDRDDRVRRLVNVTGIDSSEWEEREEFRMLDLLEEKESEIEHNDDDDDDDFDSHDSDDDQSLDLEEPGCDYEWSASSFDDVAATEAPTERTRRRVSFGPVQVQEYKVIHGEGNCLALVDGYEHDEEHGWLRTSYPSKLDYPVTLDWSHSSVEEFDLDWYESTKSQVECRFLQPNERLQRLRDMSGMSAGVLEWKERQRIHREKQQWLAQVLVELEISSDDDCETEQAVDEPVVEVSTPSVNVIVTTSPSSRRRQRPVRLTHSSSKAAIAPLPRRRSPRLASQARCSYRV